MTESLLRACICAAAALLAAIYCGHAVGPDDDCARYASCRECRDGSDTCGWCGTNGSSDARCVSLAAFSPRASCPSCELTRVAREVGCDDSTCLGVNGRVCSGHGTCKCGTCTCEPGRTGRACQNCPVKWDDCPGTADCCGNEHLCMGWLASCARCIRNERNATLCDMCPRDTRIVTSDPDHPESAECVFDSLSISSNLHCSYHVFFWRDEARILALHARIQLVCGSASVKTLFPVRKETEVIAQAEVKPVPAPEVTKRPSKRPSTAAPDPARSPPKAPKKTPGDAPEKTPGDAPKKASEKPEERRTTKTLLEGAEKTGPPSAAAATLCSVTVMLCSLCTLRQLR